jgi:hypothetical protein
MENMKLLFLLVVSTIFTVISSAQTNKPVIGSGITYENRTDILKADDCNASEAYLKKKVKAQLANFYKEYPSIAVDFSSFKGQNGYNDKKTPGRIVYPYKIELLCYLKRKVTKEGKELTELSTWKYDAVYEYATGPGKKCDFKIVPSSQKTLIKRSEF